MCDFKQKQWKTKDSALLIIQRSGEVQQISFNQTALSHRGVLPKGLRSCSKAVPAERTFTLLGPDLTLCHSTAKWGNHARSDYKFVPGTAPLPRCILLHFCLFYLTKQTQDFIFSATQTKSGQQGKLGAFVPEMDWLQQTVKVSHCPFTPSTINQYVALIKSLHESTADDINLLHHPKLHHLPYPLFPLPQINCDLKNMKQHV